MDLEALLENVIIEESKKLIARYHYYHNSLDRENKRNSKRFGRSFAKKIEKPTYWKLDKKFNPFYTKRKAKPIARSIAKAIKNKTYKPNEPYIKEIPKNPTGVRKISIYQIPDAAVSKLFYIRLLSKNKHRFSSFSYAYRNDRNVHFAIQDIWIDISESKRTFIAEFDFSDFFGSISHEYLKEQFDKNGFLISEDEKYIISTFLNGRDRGIPQGTSISLFLANLVCWELDKKFESHGLKFARYADDTVVWSLEYDKICKSFNIINDFSKTTNVQINPSKSEGISLLTAENLPSELSKPKTSIDFLGYSIHVDRVSIKEQSIKKIKKQISYILYRNLIQPLKQDKLRNITIPNNEKDENFLTAIMQIRRYLYGGLSDDLLIHYLSGRNKRIYFKGIMSFYPLVNDITQLKELDGWLLSIIYRTIQLRKKLFLVHKHNVENFFPFSSLKEELLETCKVKKVYNKKLLRIPSFILIYKAIQKGLIESGIEQTMHPDSNEYDY